MSYDIDVQSRKRFEQECAREEVDHTCSGESVEVGNYTHNVGRMYKEALGYGLNDLHGALCAVAAPSIMIGIGRMVYDPGHYRAMNPDNGWGDYEGALVYLQRIHDACVQHPDYYISVS